MVLKSSLPPSYYSYSYHINNILIINYSYYNRLAIYIIISIIAESGSDDPDYIWVTWVSFLVAQAGLSSIAKTNCLGATQFVKDQMFFRKKQWHLVSE